MARTMHRSNVINGCGNNAVKIPKMIQQSPCQWFDILPWNGAKQHQFQHFVIGQGIRTPLHEPVAQPFAMILDIGWQTRPLGQGKLCCASANRGNWESVSWVMPHVCQSWLTKI